MTEPSVRAFPLGDPSGSHPFVYFPQIELPKLAQFVGWKLLSSYPLVHCVTLYSEMSCDFFHG
jgi:hypothetical protein